MAKEIERKFLLKNDAWRGLGAGEKYRQGYLSTAKTATVRVRIIDHRAYLTIKGLSSGASRSEYEYSIPYADAAEIVEELCERPLIEKTRYRISFNNSLWEVDEFEGANQGLLLAEIELQSEDQDFVKPDWIGDEVTGDPRYYNANLVKKPFSTW
ncbi:MAG: CYTH domain-containing protein [Candidatus Binataceae bacterium]